MDDTHGPCLHFLVEDASKAGEARRVATALAEDLGFDATRAGEVAIVVSEVARNLAIHARGGELFLSTVRNADGLGGLDVLALDTGPGMDNVPRCLDDGYSTAGTAGIGLGAIARLSSSFDVCSTPGSGTVLWAQLLPRPATCGFHRPATPRVEVGVVCVPKPGQLACGDGFAIREDERRVQVLVVDGLGHGDPARAAAREAIRVFNEQPDLPPDELIHRMHGALRATRGAAVALAEIRLATREIAFVGIGNVAALVVDPAGNARNMVSHNGTVGHQLRKVQLFTYAFPEPATLLMHSDGLATQWRLDRYPGLLRRPLPSLAATLYRDFRRGRDDVTVLAVRAAAAAMPRGTDA
jgi:anti-sigma regulatory factor (Ser/Thr protein kinase)